jgi:hypothetical protein
MEYQQPIIICGMHRSGTSLVSNIIESQGVFMGRKKQNDNEPVFFLDINETIFRLLNASWDTPDNFSFANVFFKTNVQKIINRKLQSNSARSYFGLYQFLKNHDFQKINYSWGWKDPRNTFTLDYWRQIFPGVKVVHVYRNPIDVARSLQRRQEQFTERFSTNKRFEEFAVKNDFMGTSYKCLHLEEGFKLWEKYIRKAFSSGADIFHLKYEDLLENQEKKVDELFLFLGLPKKPEAIEPVLSKIDSSRKYAFFGDEVLENFYRSVRDNEWVTRLGYHQIPDK